MMNVYSVNFDACYSLYNGIVVAENETSAVAVLKNHILTKEHFSSITDGLGNDIYDNEWEVNKLPLSAEPGFENVVLNFVHYEG